MNKFFFVFFFVGATVFLGCDKSDIEYQNDFDRAHEAWLKFKASSGNSYRYTVSGGTWAGSSWLTAITVKEGRVVRRDFRYQVFNDVHMPEAGWTSASLDDLLKGLSLTAAEFEEQAGVPWYSALEWTEDENELGHHEMTPASRVQTLDDIYASARQVWLKKRDDADIYFEARNNGLISSAGFVPNGCMDDCFSGISIRSIEALD